MQIEKNHAPTRQTRARSFDARWKGGAAFPPEKRILRANFSYGSEVRKTGLSSFARAEISRFSTDMNTTEERKLLGILPEFRATTPTRR